MLFSVLAVVRGRPENTFMLFWIKSHQDHFFQLEMATKKGKKSATEKSSQHHGMFSLWYWHVESLANDKEWPFECI